MKKFLMLFIMFISLIEINAQEIKNEKIKLSGNLGFDSKLLNEYDIISHQEEIYLENKKSPFLAGLMSAVIPGAGEVYSGNYWKAAIFVAIEATCIAANIAYSKKADEKTSEFKRFADANWSVVRYAEWMNTFAEPLELGDTRIFIDPDESKSPWQRVNFKQVNEAEEKVKTFSHKLVPYGEQQYYELIGKYHQYNHGWADSDPSTLEYYTNLSPMFHQYAGMHIKPDEIYKVASTAIVLLVTNHFISALDAAWTASRFNKNLKASLDIKETNYLGRIEYYPEFSLRVNF